MSMETNENRITLNVVLSGCPPWGFNLAGGSEFGCPLFVKKVTDNSKAIQGFLLESDEILAVNDITVSSRTNAIQMVRSTKGDELKLKICRYTTEESPTKNDILHSQTMIEKKMNDYPRNNYHKKSYSTSSLNPTPSTAAGNNGSYKIVAINRDNISNEHNIRLAIPSTTKNTMRKIDSFEKHDLYQSHDHKSNERSVDAQPNRTNSEPNTPLTSQRQLVSVKMATPVQYGTRDVKNTVFKQYQAQQQQGMRLNLEETDAIETESLPNVSSARALFEQMNTKEHQPQQHEQKHNNTRPQMKNWNSGSVLDENMNPHIENSTLQQPINISHQQSRSLPIEMAGADFQKAVSAYKQHRANTKGLNALSKNFTTSIERPKSAYYPAEESKTVNNSNVTPNQPTSRLSQPDMSRMHRVKSGSQQLLNDKPRASITSQSFEDLTSIHSQQHHGQSNANQLRQAANRYHEELMKNYPKFRNTLAKDNVNKFNRKTSMPPEDSFSRGESHRATIATASTSRMTRAYSASDTLETKDSPRTSFDPNDNSMMSRLLRDNQSHAILNKIDEESKTNYPILRRTSSEIRRTTSTADYIRRNSEQIPTTVINREAKPTFVHAEPKHDREEYAMENSNIHTDREETAAIESQQNYTNSTYGTRPVSAPPPRSTEMPTEILINNYEPEYLNHRENHNISTSITEDQIIHEKEASTDSAVYMYDEIQSKDDLTNHYHERQYSNDVTKNNMEDDFNDSEYFPPPPDELLNDDDNIKDSEREKPQRTINRRKKDSTVVNTSRNNSCVSTDSTTSTATADSGIVLRSELSPRTSPVSRDQYLTGSRETLDDEVAALNDHPHATSTPERNESTEVHSYGLHRQASVGSPLGTDSSPNSRPGSLVLTSPRLDELDTEKVKLIDSMREKINELRDQEQEIGEEIRVNEDLGKKVRSMVSNKATQSEFSKYELFIGELNKIVALLLSLTQRLHRYESMLQDLDMSNENDRAKKDGLISKIEKLKSQHEEACYLRDVNDKRGDNVATFLEKYCTEEEFADFQYYVDMKSQLALMQSEIREKVKLGEERLKALQQTGNEWGFS